jgi:hypothetical protein
VSWAARLRHDCEEPVNFHRRNILAVFLCDLGPYYVAAVPGRDVPADVQTFSCWAIQHPLLLCKSEPGTAAAFTHIISEIHQRHIRGIRCPFTPLEPRQPGLASSIMTANGVSSMRIRPSLVPPRIASLANRQRPHRTGETYLSSLNTTPTVMPAILSLTWRCSR